MSQSGQKPGGSNTVTSSFSKSSVFIIHSKTQKRRFQKFPLWRAFSKSCIFGHRFHRIRVDGRPIRKGNVASSNETCGRGLKVRLRWNLWKCMETTATQLRFKQQRQHARVCED